MMNGNYAGAEWLQAQLKYVHPEITLSPLGVNVANLLGELFLGLYHLDHKALYRAEWDNTHHIIVSIGWQDWSTVDFDKLTRLVFLAHWMALRVNLEGSKSHYIRLMFHQRSRLGDSYQRHPTLDEAVQTFKDRVSLPQLLEAVHPELEEE
jgi:hypothetical protein